MKNFNDLDLDFILENLFGISNQILNDIIFKLENNIELDVCDYLLITKIKFLNLIYERSKK